MLAGAVWFNIYLVAVLALAVGVGCRSPGGGRGKSLATLRVHVEAAPEEARFSREISLFRADPLTLRVQRVPLLDEGSVSEARVVEDALGGFALQIQLNAHGTMLLEQATATHVGRRLAIFSEFGKDLAQHRWLAAPQIGRRIENGLLLFTPDATREEAEAIAAGLNRVAEKLGHRDKPGKRRSAEP